MATRLEIKLVPIIGLAILFHAEHGAADQPVILAGKLSVLANAQAMLAHEAVKIGALRAATTAAEVRAAMAGQGYGAPKAKGKKG